MRCTGLLLATTMVFATACRDSTGNNPPPPPPGRSDAGTNTNVECPGEGTTVCTLKLTSSARHPAVDDPVTLTDVVVTSATVGVSFNMGNVTLAGFYVQDPAGADFLSGRYSGIAVVYNPTSFVGRVPAPGTKVTVEGVYTEFAQAGGEPQRQVRAVRLETNNELVNIEPIVIDSPNLIAAGGADAAAYEGVLVRVNSVTVSEIMVTTPGGSIFNAFRLDGGLVVSALFYRFNGPVVGEIFTQVSGILRLGTNTFESGEYLISPRDAAEVVPQNVRLLADTIAAAVDPTSPAFIDEVCAIPNNNKPCPKVELRNVMVTVNDGYIDANLRALWVTDPNDADGKYASVPVVYRDRDYDPPPAVGSFINVDGSLQDYYGSRQVTRPTMSRSTTMTGTVAVNPRIVTPASIGRMAASAPEYQGSLVTIENVSVTEACLESNNGKDFGGWVVTGDVQIGTMFFYDYNGRPIPSMVMCEDGEGNPNGACRCTARARPDDQRMLGDTFRSITGVVYFSFGAFQLVPRGNQDLVRQ